MSIATSAVLTASLLLCQPFAVSPGGVGGQWSEHSLPVSRSAGSTTPPNGDFADAAYRRLASRDALPPRWSIRTSLHSGGCDWVAKTSSIVKAILLPTARIRASLEGHEKPRAAPRGSTCSPTCITRARFYVKLFMVGSEHRTGPGWLKDVLLHFSLSMQHNYSRPCCR